MSSSTHSRSHLLPHSQAPTLLQLLPAGSGVLKGFHAGNWLPSWTLPYRRKVVQKAVLHHLAEGCTQTLKKFLPGEQPFFSTAQSSPLCPPEGGSASQVKPCRLNRGYPRAGVCRTNICVFVNTSLKSNCLKLFRIPLL